MAYRSKNGWRTLENVALIAVNVTSAFMLLEHGYKIGFIAVALAGVGIYRLGKG